MTIEREPDSSDDFAGRVATKVMQTAFAVRQVVTLTTEVFVYVAVYFLGALVLFAQSDWRIMAPLALWFAAYTITMRFFVPKMRIIAKAQADARSDLTGRIGFPPSSWEKASRLTKACTTSRKERRA